MLTEGTPSKRPMARSMEKPERFYYDKILRDRGLNPPSNKAPDPGTAPKRFKYRDKDGRVIRALSGIMQKGNVFKGTF
jgi:hypothetical protein